ncbi:MAG: hypothetical protein KJ872_01815 [Alphaproteobacteria bacterium]|nr:hypothetical protein [Alphaproteobacteria bacterium]
MIPFLPELSVTPGPLAGAGAMPLAQPGAGLDFAGLLSAAQPAADAAAQRNAGAALITPPLPELTTLPAARVPGGTGLPEGGAILPDLAAPDITDAGTVSVAQTPDTPALPTLPEAAPEGPSDADADAPEPETGQPAPAALIAAPIAAPVAAPLVAVLVAAANPPAPVPVSARAAARAGAQVTAAPPAQTEVRPLPERAALPDTPAPAAAALLAEPAPAPAAAAAPATAPTTQAATAAAAPLAPTPAAIPVADSAEPRAPAPQQESTIAQVGELREALRAARPEMTLRHAEFGFVSLRVDATGAEGWRAVLASRDPGFVPAIHAALADRAIAATADTAGTHNSAGQNGQSDQRYGPSPNGGQGSSQPYLAQSSNRDEGSQQHPQQRHPRNPQTGAARAGDADVQHGDPRQRGVFA